MVWFSGSKCSGFLPLHPLPLAITGAQEDVQDHTLQQSWPSLRVHTTSWIGGSRIWRKGFQCAYHNPVSVARTIVEDSFWCISFCLENMTSARMKQCNIGSYQRDILIQKANGIVLSLLPELRTIEQLEPGPHPLQCCDQSLFEVIKYLWSHSQKVSVCKGSWLWTQSVLLLLGALFPSFFPISVFLISM